MSTRNSSVTLAWLQLCRIPNVFTAIADVWMGYCFTAANLEPNLAIGLLTASSICLYIAGMVLNDVYDVEQDARERPGRPIPSGRVDRQVAHVVGCLLLVLGVACGIAVTLCVPSGAMPGRAAGAAACLACCVVAYDRWLKRTWAGPLAMGSCRLLNVLLGMSLSPVVPRVGAFYHPAEWAVAFGIGCFIAGVTWFARTEAVSSHRGQLLGGLVVSLLGLCVIGAYPQLSTAEMPWRIPPNTTWGLLLAIVGLPIVRRSLAAIATPTPARVQAAVQLSILSLIILDAAICLASRGPEPAVAIALLLVPSMASARFIYST